MVAAAQATSRTQHSLAQSDNDSELAAYAAARRAMVDGTLRTNAVIDPAVVAAMASVPREAFVPSAQAPLAYSDRGVPLNASGRRLNPPLVTGRLLVAADIAPGQRVLLIGAACGYTAALLAELGAAVTALDCDAGLVAAARAALAPWPSVELAEGPLGDGWAAGAPYDRIIIDGAGAFLPDALPGAVVDQLADGGVVTAGVIDGPVTRLARGVKVGGAVRLRSFADFDMVRLPGMVPPPQFRF